MVNQYKHHFSSNSEVYGHGAGDIMVSCAGLEWAIEHNIDILVKMSRRFIPFFDWTDSLLKTAIKSQHTTFANHCSHFKYPIRSECFGMFVQSWHKRIEELRKLAIPGVKVEYDLMDFIKGFERPTCYLNDNYIINSGSYYAQYYGIWHEIGYNRMSKHPFVLWHDYSVKRDYLDLAVKYGINDYDLKDFII